MSVSRYPQITEELLSAYLDNTVSEEERQLIEHAISVEPQIAWQLESLRQTVHLLNSLPAVALPRSFTLTRVLLEEKLAAVQATEQTRERARLASRRVMPQTANAVTWWQQWLAIWQSGSPYLRNGAAVAVLLLVVLVAGNQLFTPQPIGPDQSASAPANEINPETPAAVAAVFTAGAEAPGDTEQSARAQETRDTGQLPMTGPTAAKQGATAAPAATTTTAVAVQEPVVQENAPTALAMMPATQPAGMRNEGAAANPAADGAMGGSAALPTSGRRIPGDDGMALDPVPSGATASAYSMDTQTTQALLPANAPAIEAMPQPQAALPTDSAPPTESMPAVASEIVQSNETSDEAEVMVAAGVAVPAATEVNATPTMTATTTVTPTSTAPITATATVTATITPTTTTLFQGVAPLQVQTMQVANSAVRGMTQLLMELAAAATLTGTILWWRSQAT